METSLVVHSGCMCWKSVMLSIGSLVFLQSERSAAWKRSACKHIKKVKQTASSSISSSSSSVTHYFSPQTPSRPAGSDPVGRRTGNAAAMEEGCRRWCHPPVCPAHREAASRQLWTSWRVYGKLKKEFKTKKPDYSQVTTLKIVTCKYQGPAYVWICSPSMMVYISSVINLLWTLVCLRVNKGE